MSAPLLEVRDLRVEFATAEGALAAVDGVSLTIEEAGALGLVGESGCGKTATALALLRLLPRNGRIIGGSIRLRGVELLDLPEEEMRRRRGAEIAMVFQEPSAALDPLFPIGEQVGEALRVHRGATRLEARRAAVDLLARVGIPDPERRAREHPHQLSGGMRQRACLAMALSCRPALLLADEPTSALDVTIQAQLLDLLDELRRELRMAVLLISHDLAVVGSFCDQMAVMYAGRIVERGPVARVIGQPAHPYTRGLLASRPRVAGGLAPGGRLEAIPGSVPDPRRWPPGCRFHPRCGLARPECEAAPPPLLPIADGHEAACPFTEPPDGSPRPAAGSRA